MMNRPSKASKIILAGTALVLLSPLLFFAGVIMVLTVVLLLGALLNVLFGTGTFSEINDDLIWNLDAHFYPMGLIGSCAILLIFWLLKRNRNRFP